MLQHSLEMLLKAVIRHKQGEIRKASNGQTIRFEICVQKGLELNFLKQDQVKTLQMINMQRNVAQHYLINISEHQLYLYAQAGVTSFRNIHDQCFDEKLVIDLPDRVLPISTIAPKDLSALFDKEIEEIKGFLVPGTRRKMDAIAKARSLAVLENAVKGENEQPSDRDLQKICNRLSSGEEWFSIFPGVASIKIIPASSNGLTLSLHLTKNKGIPIHLAKEDEDSNATIVTRHVNELDKYSLSASELAKKVNLTQPKCRAVVDHIELRKDSKYFKEIKIGRSSYPRYSSEAIKKIKDTLKAQPVDEIWKIRQAERKKAKHTIDKRV